MFLWCLNLDQLTILFQNNRPESLFSKVCVVHIVMNAFYYTASFVRETQYIPHGNYALLYSFLNWLMLWSNISIWDTKNKGLWNSEWHEMHHCMYILRTSCTNKFQVILKEYKSFKKYSMNVVLIDSLLLEVHTYNSIYMLAPRKRPRPMCQRLEWRLCVELACSRSQPSRQV